MERGGAGESQAGLGPPVTSFLYHRHLQLICITLPQGCSPRSEERHQAHSVLSPGTLGFTGGVGVGAPKGLPAPSFPKNVSYLC